MHILPSKLCCFKCFDLFRATFRSLSILREANNFWNQFVVDLSKSEFYYTETMTLKIEAIKDVAAAADKIQTDDYAMDAEYIDQDLSEEECDGKLEPINYVDVATSDKMPIRKKVNIKIKYKQNRFDYC